MYNVHIFKKIINAPKDFCNILHSCIITIIILDRIPLWQLSRFYSLNVKMPINKRVTLSTLCPCLSMANAALLARAVIIKLTLQETWRDKRERYWNGRDRLERVEGLIFVEANLRSNKILHCYLQK